MKKMITFQAEESLISAINNIAKKYDRSQSAQIRVILKDFVERYYNEEGK